MTCTVFAATCAAAVVVLSGAHTRPVYAHASLGGAKETVLYAFQGGTDGADPSGSLISDTRGALYGTAANGGAGGYGVVFKLTPTASGYTESVLYSFQSDEANPNGGLLADQHGALYGTTFNGVLQGVFRLTPVGSHYKHTRLCVFRANGRHNGSGANGGLIMDQSGAIYGTTYYGGSRDGHRCPTYGCGIIFKLTPSGQGFKEAVILSFGGGLSGHTPNEPLIIDQSGTLYGTTGRGGKNATWCPAVLYGCGVAFKLTPSGSGYTESVIHYFGPNGGASPLNADGLIADNAHALYGTTGFGGIDSNACDLPSQPPGCGTVYKLTPAGSSYHESVLYKFRGGNDGVGPNGALLGASDGALYGTTEAGGRSGDGIVFELTPTESGYAESVLHAFRGGTDGAEPYGSLIRDSAGALYGVTQLGGSASSGACYGGCGTVFRLTL